MGAGSSGPVSLFCQFLFPQTPLFPNSLSTNFPFLLIPFLPVSRFHFHSLPPILYPHSLPHSCSFGLNVEEWHQQSPPTPPSIYPSASLYIGFIENFQIEKLVMEIFSLILGASFPKSRLIKCVSGRESFSLFHSGKLRFLPGLIYGT
ncbi:predicted protein [Methanosarcina acetivorans C2A]|uniref:Uncharacterized protein n=1 Tax=Methanosarcina acetivorans (strain ATCC 35395 / DSM 2834 / JCM 12185 / C2A) TaxID=188937 RepID=Q8TPV9_METAC|nr:predicted protein [Methanosarcina acetivorans C2A]